MYSGEIRGGTRGGAAEFKWSDVGADKDRENYLGHSINAPTGRWQKNKDVHWYNRDLNRSELERLEEIRKIKEQEAEAMNAALGLPLTIKATTLEGGDDKPKEETEEEKEEKQRKKEEKRLRKEERKERKERRRLERRRSRSRSRSRSPVPYDRRLLPSREPPPHIYDDRHRTQARSPQHRRASSGFRPRSPSPRPSHLTRGPRRSVDDSRYDAKRPSTPSSSRSRSRSPDWNRRSSGYRGAEPPEPRRLGRYGD